MKKIALFLFLLIISVMTVTISFAATKDVIHCNPTIIMELLEKNPTFEFILPESAEIIEEEAFEGTAIIRVKLPNTMTTIGERAFANISTLRSVQFPVATKTIAETAFIGSNHVTITAAPNSYARKWAKENKIPFSPIIVMYAGTGGQNQNITASLSSASKEISDTESSETKNANRNWRKLEEIQVFDTIEIIANHVQSRAPPMA